MATFSTNCKVMVTLPTGQGQRGATQGNTQKGPSLVLLWFHAAGLLGTLAPGQMELAVAAPSDSTE